MELLDINNGGGQGYGFIVYRTQLHENSLKLTIAKVKDRAIVSEFFQPTFFYENQLLIKFL